MHTLISIDSILIPDYRQRGVITDISVIDLANDIASTDLLHPISIRAENPPTLLAGHRRLEAVKQLHRKEIPFKYADQPVPIGFIPAVRVSERDELAYLEAEWSENAQRLDLTWQEQSLARAKLHELRCLQNEKQTITDTATELTPNPTSWDRVSLTDDLRLTRHFDDPDILKAKTKKEATKLLDLKLRQQHHATAKLSFSSFNTPHKLFEGDCLKGLEELPPASYDLLLTDPPYGIGAHTFGDQTRINHHYDDTFETWSVLLTAFEEKVLRVCTDQAHAYIFCDISRWSDLAKIFCKNWKVWPRPLIWYKGNMGTLPRPNHGPRYTYEAILFATRGDSPILKIGAHDVLSYPSSPKPTHAAEKPVALYTDLIERSVAPGAQILDPFCGSGTIFPAANITACFATGIELDHTSYNIALSRIEGKE